MITAGVHLYGSQRGYRTIARSSDVTAAEDSALAGIGFGQANAPSMLASLNSAPTALGRLLPSGRFAVTRALPGPSDDAGRPTIVLCTLIFSSGDYASIVRHHLARLVAERSLWDADRLATGDRVTLRLRAPAPRQPTDMDLRIADAWLQAQGRTDTLAVLPDGCEASVLALPQVLATDDALRFRWGIRLLGVDAGAEVGTLVQGAATGRRRTVPCGLAGPYRSQWLSFLAAQDEWSTPLPLHQGVTTVEELASPASTPGTRPERRTRRASPRMLASLVGAVVVVVAAAALIAPAFKRNGGADRPIPVGAGSAVGPPRGDEPDALGTESSADPAESIEREPTAPAPIATAGVDVPPAAGPEARVRRFGDDAPRRAVRQPAEDDEHPPSIPENRPPRDPPAQPAHGAPAPPPAPPPPRAAPAPETPERRQRTLLESLAKEPPDRFDTLTNLDGALLKGLFAQVAKDLSTLAADGAWRPLEVSPGARERLAPIGRLAEERAKVASIGAAWIAAIVNKKGSGAESVAELSDRWAESKGSEGEIWDSLQRAEIIRDTLGMLYEVSAKIRDARAALAQMRGSPGADLRFDLDPFDDTSVKAVERCFKESATRLDRWTKRVAALEKASKKASPGEPPPSIKPDP